MSLATTPGSTRLLDEETRERGKQATITFAAIMVASITLLCWVGPAAPRVFLGLFGAWAINVVAWRPAKGVAGYAFLAALVVGLVKIDFSQLPLTTLLYAGAVVLICLAPSLAAPLRLTDNIPTVHMFCLVAAIYTATGAFLSHESRLLTQFVTPADRREGLLLYGTFLACLVAAGSLVTILGRSQWRKAGEREEAEATAPADPTRAAEMIAVGIMLALVVRVLGIGPKIGVLVDVVYCMRLIGYLVLFRMWLEKRPLSPWMRALLVLGLVLDVLLGLGSAALFQAARTPFAMTIMYIHVRRRIPWVALTLAVMAILSLNIQKDTFRARAGGLGKLNQGNLVNQGVSYATDWITSVPHTTKDALSVSASRFSYGTSDLLGYLRKRVPREIPYWDARTYRYIPLTALPRVIAPWKPTTLSGVQFGQRYDLVNPGSTDTSANLPLSAEAYVNFGIAGIVLVGLAFGAVLGLVGRVLRGSSWPLALVGAVVTAQLVGGVESDSSVVIGVAIWLGVFAYPMARWTLARPGEGLAPT